MCARRFLILIFILTLIFVGGAFALYQFGDQVLVRMATPSGHYRDPPKGSAPDYASDTAWLAKPGLAVDHSGWLPEGVIRTTSNQSAATFYVHPTTYLERDRWNASIDAAGEPAQRAAVFVETQAGAFNGISDIWAPKYRQAAYGAFLLKSGDAQKALDLAYRDVLAAFDRFLSAQPAGKPVILAGHSQGSLHLLRLLADRKDALKGRLVAAYVIGWPVGRTSDLPATGLPACTAAAQTGCVLSWQSFREPANTGLVTRAWVGTRGLAGTARSREDMLCTNPLTGVADGSAPASANHGTLLPDGGLTTATLEPARIGANCDKGFLMIDGDVPNLGPYVLPGNNYHVYDYALFWGSIRADAERRLAKWRAL
jgi:pimeloyl-ACP methyl ester carboxylesterase